ncbi:TetR/AcrR family transcriptional regulator [Geodermatophilus sp. SYSU D01176]
MAPRSPGAGSREQRRARIEQTALELFRTRGFDQVTVEDLCSAAGVAPATFYRHFGTKEEVVFAYRDAFAAALQTALAEAADLPSGMRLPVVLGRFAEFLESQQDLLALRDQIVLGHPRLLQRTLTVQRDMEAALASGLARLRGLPAPDPAALLEAGVGIVVLRVALRSWRAQGGGSLVAAMRETLVQLREVTAGLAVGGE